MRSDYQVFLRVAPRVRLFQFEVILRHKCSTCLSIIDAILIPRYLLDRDVALQCVA